MSYVTLPAVMRNEAPNFGVIALIILALISVTLCFTNPEAITAEYQSTTIAGP
jgi:hypothetical protein